MPQQKQTSSYSWFMVLFLIFLVLKLTGYITWSWWWVTAPLWGGFALGFVFSFIFSLRVAESGDQTRTSNNSNLGALPLSYR